MRTIVALRYVILLAGGALACSRSRSASSGSWRGCRAEDAALDRNAEGIVVLTGGAARINDAIELLAAGRGHRLLITGVNPTTHTGELARLAPHYERLFGCCIDLDHSAVNTIGNAIETRRWTQAARLPLAARRHLGLPHAARHRRAVARASRRDADRISGIDRDASAPSRGGRTTRPRGS